MNPVLTLIVPCFNEAENLVELLPGFLSIANVENWKLIIVDDGSTDQTEEIVKVHQSERLLYLKHKKNMGVGAAIKTGIVKVQTEYFATIDADGQHKLEDVKSMFAHFQEESYDLFLGERLNGDVSGTFRSIGKFLIKLIAVFFAKQKIKDLNTGLRIIKLSAIQPYIEILPDSFSFMDLNSLIFIMQRKKIGSSPIYVNVRKHGKSALRIRHALETVSDIINVVTLFHPIRIFLPTTLFFIALGTIWGLPYILMGRGLSVGALLFILMGVFSFFFGIVAEQLSQIRKKQLNLHE